MTEPWIYKDVSFINIFGRTFIDTIQNSWIMCVLQGVFVMSR